MIIITLAFAAFIGPWVYYASKDMTNEKLDKDCLKSSCKGCPFANKETQCCDHQFWAPSMCMLKRK